MQMAENELFSETISEMYLFGMFLWDILEQWAKIL